MWLYFELFERKKYWIFYTVYIFIQKCINFCFSYFPFFFFSEFFLFGVECIVLWLYFIFLSFSYLHPNWKKKLKAISNNKKKIIVYWEKSVWLRSLARKVAYCSRNCLSFFILFFTFPTCWLSIRFITEERAVNLLFDNKLIDQ